MKLTFIRGIAIGGLLICAVSANAQSVLQSEPSATPVPSSLREAVQSSPFTLPTAPIDTTTPLRWGQFAARPHFTDRFIYSDGIQAVPGQLAESYINSFSPGVAVDIGSHWTVDYTPTWTAYSNRIFKDSLDHSLSVVGGADLGDWLVQAAQSYRSTNAPRVETGRQTNQESIGTGFNLSHRFDNHWSVELGVAQDLQYIEQSPNYYDWSTEDWLTYRVVSRLAFSFGYRIGYTDFDPGAYMTYSRPQLRVQWRATDKLTLNAQIGRDHRQVHKTGFSSQDTPTLNGTIQYQPFDQTTLTIGANRAVSPAYFNNSVIEGKGWSVELQQRLFGHVTLSTGISEQKSHYVGSHTEFITTGTTVTPIIVPDLRDDRTKAFHVRLGTKLLNRGTISLIYERSQNESNIAIYSFTSHQIGCEVGYRW